MTVQEQNEDDPCEDEGEAQWSNEFSKEQQGKHTDDNDENDYDNSKTDTTPSDKLTDGSTVSPRAAKGTIGSEELERIRERERRLGDNRVGRRFFCELDSGNPCITILSFALCCFCWRDLYLCCETGMCCGGNVDCRAVTNCCANGDCADCCDGCVC